MSGEAAPRAPGGPGGEEVLRAVAQHVRAFAGLALAALYVPEGAADPGAEAGALRLAGSAGAAPAAGYGLAERYELSGGSMVAEAYHSRRAVWADAAGELRGAMGVLPLGADGDALGCLVVVDAPEEAAAGTGQGFSTGRRGFLELYAGYASERIAADERETGRIRLGWFALTLGSGLVEADPETLKLMGVAPTDFDGRLESLLVHTAPEDLPVLLALVDPAPGASGGRRDLEFRTRLPSGELRWLHARCLVRTRGTHGPGVVLGLVTDASHMRPPTNEVWRVQRLSARLATALTVEDVNQVVVSALRELGADRVALVRSEADRTVIARLDPPDLASWPESWRAAWPESPYDSLQTVLRGQYTSVWPSGRALSPELAEVGRGGLAVLPLPDGGRVVGAWLAGWDEPHRFGTVERLLLTAVASMVGQAMVRAHAVDTQHELAAMVQRSLLPRTLPPLPGGVTTARYLPATVELDVGGDWYDVIPITDRHMAVVIGDVQGHSAAAATIMGQMRTAIRAYAVEGHSPDVVVSHANRLLLGMETDLFATCCYVAMDMEEGDAWLVRAGHLPPLVRDPDGGTRELDVEGGPPLGVVADPEFPMTTVELTPGTVLTLLTDGLVESSTLYLEDGLRRVHEVLSATEPSDLGVLADALIGGSRRRDDDVALLLLRYDGMRVKPRRASWTLWRLPDAVGHARRFTARTLRSWRVGEGADAALLVVSELVTNALVHTQGQVRLDLTLSSDNRLWVAVSDSSPRTPAKSANVDWEATGGRGILILEAVSSSWGSVPLSGGKQVWGEIPVSVQDPESEDAGAEGNGLQSLPY